MSELMDIYEPEAEEILLPDSTLDQLADGFLFTEGPVWDFAAEHLVFSDIPGDTMYRYRTGEGVSIYRKPSNFSNGMTLDTQGRIVVCEHRTRRLAREVEPGRFETVADSYQGHPLNAPNDVIMAPDGSIVFTDPHYGLGEGFGGPAEQALPHRGVYRIPPDTDEPKLLVSDCEGPNGLALSPSGDRLYVVDTEQSHIRVFEVDDDWRLSGGDVLVRLSGEGEGVPDGLKVDEEGTIYCTGPGGIFVCSPEGTVLGLIRIPEVAANLAWGDDDAQTLYITASDKLYRLATQRTGFVSHRPEGANQ
jgi:gluconolactonase